MPLFIKTPKNIFSYGLSQYDKNSAYTMPLDVSEAPEEGMGLRRSYWKNKGVGKYIHVKLKTWKERIRTNYHSQDVPHDTYCNAKAVLKIECVYKQNKKNHPQLYVEKCKYTNAEGQQCNMLDNSDDDGCFEEWNRTWTGVSYIRHTTICEDKSLLPS